MELLQVVTTVVLLLLYLVCSQNGSWYSEKGRYQIISRECEKITISMYQTISNVLAELSLACSNTAVSGKFHHGCIGNNRERIETLSEGQGALPDETGCDGVTSEPRSYGSCRSLCIQISRSRRMANNRYSLTTHYRRSLIPRETIHL